MIAAFRRWAFDPVDTAPMAALRIACGLITIGWTLSLLPDLQTFLGDHGLTAHAVSGSRGWWTVDLVNPWAAVLLLLAAAVALTVGFRTRVASVLVFLLLIAIQRRDVYVLNSGDLLLRVLAFFVMLMPAGQTWSLDARGRLSRPRAPYGLRLLQLQVSGIYLFSVVAKMHGDSWQDGTAVGRAVQLADLQRLVVPQGFATSVTISSLLTYGTLVVEGALVFGLWLPRFRWWVMAAGVSIHLGIEATLLIGWFSFAILSTYLAFIPAETLRTAVRWALERVGLAEPQRPTLAPAFEAVLPGPPVAAAPLPVRPPVVAPAGTGLGWPGAAD